VTALIKARRLQQVACDPDTVEILLASARRHIASAKLTAERDPEAAFCLAYDAARKSATALLNQQGLRPTAAGGHIAVVDAISAQFPGVPGLASLDRLRRRRNQAEYPDPRGYDPITVAEANDAITVAGSCVSSARRLLRQGKLGVF
jgi:hypothetical protein